MRAIKSVLVVAGGFKRADPSLTEQAVLMRSLRDTNVAKIEGLVVERNGAVPCCNDGGVENKKIR